MKSFLTDSEIEALPSSGIDFSIAPAVIRGASKSQFSVARHFGGCKAYGKSYTYCPVTDELIRGDVLKFVMAARKKDARDKVSAAEERQGRLF